MPGWPRPASEVERMTELHALADPELREPVAFPPKVAGQLHTYWTQIQVLQNQQLAYLAGVLQALGIDGRVRVNPEQGTYQVVDE